LPTWNKIVQEKLDITACEYRKDLPTALTVCIAYKTDRMMVTTEPINLHLEDLLENEAVRRKLGQARHLHLACALRRPAKWVPILRSLRERGVTISADFGWNPDISINQLVSIIRHCDFIFPNEHEARTITNTTSAMNALERLQDWVRVPVVKLGARGSMLMAEGKVYTQPALPVPLVDATGVGDAFNGGFLHAFLHGMGWDDCLRSGNICASMAGTQPGGSQGLPEPREYKRHMTKMRNG
jgi:sugar/nucleoside kinase (ribokinase family)